MFVSRLRGQAKVCQFSVKCPKDQCKTEVSYMDKMVSHQLVRGLVDSAVQERVLAEAATKQLDLKQIQEFVQAQESGARSSKLLNEANVSKISDFKRGRSNTLPGKLPSDNSQAGGGGDKIRCVYCNKVGHGKTPSEETRKKSCKAWGLTCHKCKEQNHMAYVCKKKPAGVNNVSDGEETDLFQLTSAPTKAAHKRHNMRTLSHMAVDQFGQWQARSPDPQPYIKVGIKVSEASYGELGVPAPVRHNAATVNSIPDTGAQVLVGGMDLVHSLGVKKHELFPVSQRVRGANASRLELIGGLLLEISVTAEDGSINVSRQMVYISEGV